MNYKYYVAIQADEKKNLRTYRIQVQADSFRPYVHSPDKIRLDCSSREKTDTTEHPHFQYSHTSVSYFMIIL